MIGGPHAIGCRAPAGEGVAGVGRGGSHSQAGAVEAASRADARAALAVVGHRVGGVGRPLCSEHHIGRAHRVGAACGIRGRAV